MFFLIWNNVDNNLKQCFPLQNECIFNAAILCSFIVTLLPDLGLLRTVCLCVCRTSEFQFYWIHWTHGILGRDTEVGASQTVVVLQLPLIFFCKTWKKISSFVAFLFYKVCRNETKTVVHQSAFMSRQPCPSRVLGGEKDQFFSECLRLREI